MEYLKRKPDVDEEQCRAAVFDADTLARAIRLEMSALDVTIQALTGRRGDWDRKRIVEAVARMRDAGFLRLLHTTGDIGSPRYRVTEEGYAKAGVRAPAWMGAEQ